MVALFYAPNIKYKAIEPATAAFKLSVFPGIGMVIILVQEEIVLIVVNVVIICNVFK